MSRCSVPKCENSPYTKGLCEVHYWRQRRHGDPTVTKRERGRVCSIKGCGRPHKAHGYCRLHARRFKANGDPETVKVLRVPGRTCTVKGCQNTYAAKGLCTIHYQRWLRHGVPLAEPKIAPAGAPLRFLEKALKWKSDECLYWPFHRVGGYARLSRHHGIGQNVCRIICERVHGKAPSKKHEAAHSCGNGHEGCVNQRHLTWKTPKENGADKATHVGDRGGRGSRHYRAKLNEKQVREIRSLKGTMRQIDIAKRFGVEGDTISAIYHGRSWAWLK